MSTRVVTNSNPVVWSFLREVRYVSSVASSSCFFKAVSTELLVELERGLGIIIVTAHFCDHGCRGAWGYNQERCWSDGRQVSDIAGADGLIRSTAKGEDKVS
mgnify:CR=1 FL=1